MGLEAKPRLWAFNCSSWQPTESEWTALLAAIDPAECTRISRFRNKIDAKRSLIGRLLIRCLLFRDLKLKFMECKLGRTSTKKPYLLDPVPAGISPYFNFNISHHGSWVVLASHSKQLVGVDVMNVEWPRGCKSITAYFDLMKNCFAEYEWNTIKSAARQLCGVAITGDINSYPDSFSVRPSVAKSESCSTNPPCGPCIYPINKTDMTLLDKKRMKMLPIGWNKSNEEWAQLTEFSRHWAMKESYIKAIGIGLGLEDLTRAKFMYLHNYNRANQTKRNNTLDENANSPKTVIEEHKISSMQLEFDGKIKKDWKFRLFQLDHLHVVSVALGPINEATPSFGDVLYARRSSEQSTIEDESIDIFPSIIQTITINDILVDIHTSNLRFNTK